VGIRASRIGMVVALVAGATAGTAAGPPAGAQTIVAPYQPADSTVAYQANALHDGKVAGATVTPPLTRRWTRDLGGNVSYPIVADGKVFVTATNGPCCGQGSSVFALDGRTGENVWGPFNLGRAFVPRAGLTYGQGLLFVQDDNGLLRAFDARTGRVWWTVAFEDMYFFSGAPTYANGLVFVGGAGVGGTVYAVGATDGVVRWKRAAGGNPDSALAVSADLVYLSNVENTKAFAQASGAPVWDSGEGYETGPVGGATPVLSNGRVWLRETGILYPASTTLDAATGALGPSFTAAYAPAFDGPTGYFVTDGVLRATDTPTRELLWSFQSAAPLVTPPLIANGHVYVGDQLGTLWALNARTGEAVWSDAVGAVLGGFDERDYSRPVAGLAAGQGMVVVPAGTLVVAYAGAPRVPGAGLPYHPLVPARILDTRAGVGAPVARIGAGASLPLQVTGRGGVPATGVSAVLLNVTVTEPTAASFLTAWPAGQPRPLASNLNYVAGQTVPNLVTAKVGEGGQVNLYNHSGSTHVVADVAGWYGTDPLAGGSGFNALPPARILDTRTGAGAKLGPGATLDVQVTGRAEVPVSGVSAVVLNVTVTEPTAGGFLTAWPAGQARPLASNLNFVAGQTVPNLVVVKVGTAGTISLFNLQGATHVVADVAGWYGEEGSTGDGFVALAPSRILDTRTGTGAPAVKLGPASAVALQVTGRGGVPATGVSAVVLNVTVTEPTAGSFLTAWPGGEARPLASNLNYVAGQTVPNLVLVKVGAGGQVSLFNSSGSTHAVADVAGWFG
jgi:outer membrane protein assembly factor BamB